jgi:glycosyltransferase involved in cell wall biosynthesis
MSGMPAVSIVLPTYNRASELPSAINSALDQTAPPETFELLIVDNNSTDATADVIDGFATAHPERVQGVFEARQGVAFARQAGVDRARAPILAFFDDDVRVSKNWIETIVRTFAEHPAVDCIGGKVLPEWSAPPPDWLTRAHWAPLALQDFGDEPIALSFENRKGLISANLACRRCTFERVGGFSPELQRVKNGIGSLEDEDWMRRLWKAGGRALYTPELVATTEIPSTRLSRAYHRKWHGGHGRFYARLRAEEIENTSVGSLFGVPAHMYRSALGDVAGWIRAALRGRSEQAFQHEVKLRFFHGFVAQRFLERHYS